MVTLPVVSADKLTTLLRQERGISDLSDDQATWDFNIGLDGSRLPGPGKTYEVILWKPEAPVSHEVIRAYFQKRGATGHVGAFLQWLRQTPRPTSEEIHYTTIPEDNACWRNPFNDLLVPCSISLASAEILNQKRVNQIWDIGWTIVGFKEITSVRH